MTLNSKIEIQRPVKLRNAYGEANAGWETFALLWADVNYKGGREGYYARQVVATGEVVFKIRYTSGISPAMRILYDGKVYDITAVAEVGRRYMLELVTKQRDNE